MVELVMNQVEHKQEQKLQVVPEVVEKALKEQDQMEQQVQLILAVAVEAVVIHLTVVQVELVVLV
jgi:hypothetical protein